MDYRSFIPFSAQLADIAGAIIRPHFRTNVTIDTKADSSPVTIADRSVEKALREAINAHFPDHGILGEEYGSEKTDAEFVWVLDPIDGTRSFIAGLPLFGTLISLLHNTKPILGILDQPISGERWLGVSGSPTIFNGKSCKTRSCTDKKQAMISTTSPHLFNEADFVVFDTLRPQCHYALYGNDCYAYGLLASGFIDIVLEAGLKPYDYCALAPIIEGAGGAITDWHGAPLSLHSDGRVLACGDKMLHEQILKEIT